MLNNNRFLEKITSRTKIYLAIIAFLLIIICINKPVFIVPGIILFILIFILIGRIASVMQNYQDRFKT